MNKNNGKIHVNSVEIFSSSRCNLRCAHCTACAPFMTESHFPDLEKLERSLSALSKVMHTVQVKILGGEPLLNENLIPLMHVVKNSGFSDRIRICTNGILLHRVSEEFWKNADVVEISHYININKVPSNQELASFAAQAENYGVRFEVNPIGVFQESFVNVPMDNAKLIAGIYRECREVHEIPCHTVVDSSFFLCSRIHNLDRWLSSIYNRDLGLTREAELEITDRPTLKEELVHYLNRSIPLEACRYCLGTSGKTVPHRQLSVPELEQECKIGAFISDLSYMESAFLHD